LLRRIARDPLRIHAINENPSGTEVPEDSRLF
jgi:hypothetical protein